MGGRKVATTVYLTPEQDSLLKVVHQHTRLAVAELVRQGVDLVLERYSDAMAEVSNGRLVAPFPPPPRVRKT